MMKRRMACAFSDFPLSDYESAIFATNYGCNQKILRIFVSETDMSPAVLYCNHGTEKLLVATDRSMKT